MPNKIITFLDQHDRSAIEDIIDNLTAEDVGALSNLTTLADLAADENSRLVTDEEKAAWNAKPDWNQNDPTAPDYVNNRPFYVGGNIEITLADNVEITSTMLNVTLTSFVDYSGYLIITFDGVDYKCDIWNIDGTIGAGNSLLIEYSEYSNDCPFCVFFVEMAQKLMMGIRVNDENGHIISVKSVVEDPVKIPSKFLINSNIINGEGEKSTKTVGSTNSIGIYSFAEGCKTVSGGSYSHAEGYDTVAFGKSSHAEGNRTLAAGNYAHVEGSGSYRPASGFTCDANSTTFTYPSNLQEYIVAGNAIKYNENVVIITSVDSENLTFITDSPLSTDAITSDLRLYIYYEGIANGAMSHAEGASSATGSYSHSEGFSTIANSNCQHVQGRYNIVDETGGQSSSGTYLHIVGNGTFNTKRSNAHTLDWSGNAWFAGDVYVGSTSGKNKDEGSKVLATQEYVDIRVPAWTEADEGKVLKIVNGVPTWANIEITSADDGAGNVVIS